jgi:hypothetical protein
MRLNDPPSQSTNHSYAYERGVVIEGIILMRSCNREFGMNEMRGKSTARRRATDSLQRLTESVEESAIEKPLASPLNFL